ncbi:uncharacterized protein LY89DRAFT_72783 [Mollisia scopiformis]|uniref:Uncharacterized protein n=1 Tax=Mollisia scopiformis TaxID=149040 RepID=A0A194XAE2_MOLSC|nr:uncharacterized protein LY89DRAFT_72783 [Mollisia scopiformis]KUJ17143.1 hypothetical protein LY89DRAFT_72783 [Mollisia scopiformis]
MLAALRSSATSASASFSSSISFATEPPSSTEAVALVSPLACGAGGMLPLAAAASSASSRSTSFWAFSMFCSVLAIMSRNDDQYGRTYSLSLGLLVRLPEIELLLSGCQSFRDFSSSHRRLNLESDAIFEDRRWAVEFGARSWSWRLCCFLGVFALLAFLSTGASKVIFLFLLDNLHAFDTRIIDSSLGGGCELRRGLEGCFLRGVRRVQESHQRLSTTDLIQVGLVACLSKHLLSTLLSLLLVVLVVLRLLALPESLTSFKFVLLDRTVLLEVVVLDLLDRTVLLLLLILQLCTFVPESVDALECIILLSLNCIKLALDLVVFLRQGLRLRIFQLVAKSLKLLLLFIDLLLTVLKASETLTLFAQVRDLSQILLLLDDLHITAVDLLLQSVDLTIQFIDILIVNSTASYFLLSDKVLNLLVLRFYLVEDLVTTGLSCTLLLTDFLQLGEKFSATLSRRGIFILRLCEVKLALNFRL